MMFPTKTIRDVTGVLIDYRGKTPTKTPSGVKLITAKVIKDGFIVEDEHEYIAEDDYDGWMRRGLPKQWDILITTEAPLGEVAQLRSSERIALAQRVILLRGDPAVIDQGFYFQALKSPFVQSGLKARSSGTTVLGIKQSELWHVEIPCPDLQLQRRIASILAAYDDLIENNIRRIKILEEMAQMLYRDWFVNFRFPGHEKVRMVESELGPFPQGWTVQTVGTISDNFDSKRKPLSSMERAKRPGPYPYYGAAKIVDSIDGFLFDGRYLLFAEDGTVVTNDRRPVLQLTNGKFWPNNHTHVLKGRSPASTYFLYLAMRQVDISGYITGAAQPKITQANLNRIPVLVSSAETLHSFESFVSPMLDQVAMLESKHSNLRATRDFLLPKLISGEVPVQAADEQTAELLEQTA